MAEETKKTPQTPEEIAREAQAQAMKAALEQAQALYGNIPGFEGTDLMKMHEKLMQDLAEMFPGVAQAQAYQAKMMGRIRPGSRGDNGDLQQKHRVRREYDAAGNECRIHAGRFTGFLGRF